MTEGDTPARLLARQRVLVIGGGSRMGLATARLAASQGGEIILSSRNAEKLRAAAASMPGAARAVEVDASNPSQVERLLSDLAPLDHVVVTASSSGRVGGVPGTPPDAAREAFERFWINYHVLHFARGHVRAGGSITLLSGSSGRRPEAGYGVWSTMHTAIEGLARAAALELAPIRVNVVSPGGIGLHPDRQLTHHAGRPEDVASMILALMLNPAVTNTVIDVDGGERLGTWSGS